QLSFLFLLHSFSSLTSHSFPLVPSCPPPSSCHPNQSIDADAIGARASVREAAMIQRTSERRRKATHHDTGSGEPAAAPPAKPSPAKRAKTVAPRDEFEKKVIALVYDFDGTLSPKSMQEYTFLPKIGEDPEAFWAESNRIAREQGADSLITYMH